MKFKENRAFGCTCLKAPGALHGPSLFGLPDQLQNMLGRYSMQRIVFLNQNIDFIELNML